MIKKKIILFVVVITAIVLAGCPAILKTDFADTTISLGLIRPAELTTTSILTAVGGKMYVPVFIDDQHVATGDGSYDVTFTLDTDGDLTTIGDNVIVSTVPVIAGIETILELDVPASIVDGAAGTYNLFAGFDAYTGEPATDIGGTQLNISVVTVVIDVTANYLSDLVIELVDPPTMFRKPGATFLVSFKITNTGNKKIDSGTAIAVRFTHEGAAVVNAPVTLEADLYPNGFVTGTATITMPTLTEMAADEVVAEADVDDWNGTLSADVDPDNAIVEIVEGDTATYGLDSGTAQPDLLISSIDIPDFSVSGSTIEVSITIQNDGYIAAVAGSYGLILFNDVNTDGVYDAGSDTIINEWAAANTPAVPWDIDGDGRNEVVFNTMALDPLVNYPASMTAGDYEIGAHITGSLTEWDSTNNTNTGNLHLISKRVDLEQVMISTTHNTIIDSTGDTTVSLSLGIVNNGVDALETDFSVAFYMSDNPGLNTGDTLLGTVSVTDNLSPGTAGAIQIEYDATVVTGTTSDFYTIFAILDSGSVVSETDESNNIPANASFSPVYVIVDDGTSDVDMDVNFVMCSSGTEDVDIYAYFDDSAWTGTTTSSGWYYDLQNSAKFLSATLSYGILHGFYIYSTDDTAAFAWRIVPDYVNSLEQKYWPAALVTDDAYEQNDTSGTATDLDSSENPFYEWVNSYDTNTPDLDYYEFTY